MKSPTPEQIKLTRLSADLTQKQAAAIIHVLWKTWQRYESGDREMHPAFWELFLIKTGQKTLD